LIPVPAALQLSFRPVCFFLSTGSLTPLHPRSFSGFAFGWAKIVERVSSAPEPGARNAQDLASVAEREGNVEGKVPV
jgi:hypothetical protein